MSKAAEIRTERGRAWVKASSPEQKISFPAAVVIDRTDPRKPLLRIEGMDPLGATHALLILDSKKRLSWIDYDQRRVYEMDESWHGIPLAKLPELLLGFATLPENGRVGAASGDSFEVRSGANLFRYFMTWIDPGPRLALGGIDGELGGREPRKYVVHYSHFLDKDDFYLPAEVQLSGYSTAANAQASSPKPDIELSVSWRERAWNEPVPPQAFQVPKAAANFKRE